MGVLHKKKHNSGTEHRGDNKMAEKGEIKLFWKSSDVDKERGSICVSVCGFTEDMHDKLCRFLLR